ncbi:hypothetical protein PM708P3_00036 [Parabacteroides phage PM708P3]|nr:hypothetical protein PM708P3_00036 [Parabacteroides phage PM708P3]
MKFTRLKIMEEGLTTNFQKNEKDGEYYPLFVTEQALESLAKVGNIKPVHCRKTHDGADMLDGYIGKFDNFVHEGNAVYADLTISPAMETAYPQEVKFIATMIEKEPEMLGVSVVQYDRYEFDTKTNMFNMVSVDELFSCDLVGLPAATTSLFNNQLIKKTMNKFFSAFASVFKPATKFATNTVDLWDGGTITIESAGEELAVGDKVFDADGNTAKDGNYKVKDGDNTAILVVEGGVVKEMIEADKPEKEPEKKPDPETKAVPEEFAAQIEAANARITALETQLADMVSKFNKTTGKPTAAGKQPGTFGEEKKAETKLSKDKVAEAAAKFYK